MNITGPFLYSDTIIESRLLISFICVMTSFY